MYGYGDYQTMGPAARATLDGGPECDRCGAPGGTGLCPDCARAEDRRREMHRDRGRQITQRTRRLGTDRSPEARRLADWHAARWPAIRAKQVAAAAAYGLDDDDLPF